MAADEVPSISKLRDITANLYTREYVAIKNTKFASTSDRLQAYEQGREAQESAIELLKMEERSKPLSTPDKNTAAQEVWKYVRASLWSAFNAVRNMKLRADYIKKIKSTAEDATAQINGGGLTIDELQELTQQAVDARNLALEITRAKLARTSRYFSEWLKTEGLTYNELVGATESVAAAVACFGGIAASFILVAAVAPLLGSLFDLMVRAVSLRIPPDLKLPIITAIKVPLDSALSEELSSPL